MRLASIDIGTNSVLLLICQAGEDGSLTVVREVCTITRLGQGVTSSGRLHQDAIHRTLDALATFASEMAQASVAWRAAVGTEALRKVDNATDFLAQAERLLGCPVEVVSGQREAQLMVAGVTGDFGPLPGRSLLVDIGGGSTELVLIEEGRLAEPPLSLSLGAVQLTERYLRSDPPGPREIGAVRGEARATLGRLPPTLLQVDRLIGTAGTITTLASVHLGLERYDTDRVNRLDLDSSTVALLHDLFRALSLEQRQGIPGLDPARADVILAGTVILMELMRLTLDRLTVCDRGVRWGLLRQGLVAGGPTPEQ